MFRFSFVGAYEKEKVFDVTHHVIVETSEVAIDHMRGTAGETRRLYNRRSGSQIENTNERTELEK
jgi:hypothetical protein